MNATVKNWVNEYMNAEQSRDYIGCGLLLERAKRWRSLRNLLLICAYLDDARPVDTVEDCQDVIRDCWIEMSRKLKNEGETN